MIRLSPYGLDDWFNPDAELDHDAVQALIDRYQARLAQLLSEHGITAVPGYPEDLADVTDCSWYSSDLLADLRERVLNESHEW